jgi:hypothetical protein
MTSSYDSIIIFLLRNRSSVKLHSNCKYAIFEMCSLGICIAYWSLSLCSLTLREEHRLRVFENRVLRRDEVTGEWRKLHNEELHN